ncbi:zinc ribbon domain-containing protein [Streptantibioticus parmotrematis]|uniref:zinc ribbon domain-containing protein n=1 Tax=Streptantibioticus parmotrematis TaxID=2873249 RepID=UPI0033C90510
MSAEIHFAGNYRDLCEQYGTSAGFQFEFSCSRCQDAWRSPFEAYTGGRLSGWLNRGMGVASGLLGRVGNDLGTAAEGLAGAGWGGARDAAFRRAIERAGSHFDRCARCTSHVCARCWNADQGLCLVCAPDTAAETAAARQRGLNDAVTERAYAAGQRGGDSYDVDSARQLVCPSCRSDTHGGRFCPACGTQVASPEACAGCGGRLPQGAAFCPDCGHHR